MAAAPQHVASCCKWLLRRNVLLCRQGSCSLLLFFFTSLQMSAHSTCSLPVGIGCVRSTSPPWIHPCPRQDVDVLGQATHRFQRCAVVLRSGLARKEWNLYGITTMLHALGFRRYESHATCMLQVCDSQACGFRLRESDNGHGMNSRYWPSPPQSWKARWHGTGEVAHSACVGIAVAMLVLPVRSEMMGVLSGELRQQYLLG